MKLKFSTEFLVADSGRIPLLNFQANDFSRLLLVKKMNFLFSPPDWFTQRQSVTTFLSRNQKRFCSHGEICVSLEMKRSITKLVWISFSIRRCRGNFFDGQFFELRKKETRERLGACEIQSTRSQNERNGRRNGCRSLKRNTCCGEMKWDVTWAWNRKEGGGGWKKVHPDSSPEDSAVTQRNTSERGCDASFIFMHAFPPGFRLSTLIKKRDEIRREKSFILLSCTRSVRKSRTRK